MLAPIATHSMVVSFDQNFPYGIHVDRRADMSVVDALEKNAKTMSKSFTFSMASVGVASGLIFLRDISFYHAVERAGFWRGVPIITGVRWPNELTLSAALCLGAGFSNLLAQSMLVEGCWFEKVFDKNSELTRSERAKAVGLCSLAALGMLTSAYVIKNIGYFMDANRLYFLREYCQVRGLPFNWQISS